MIRIEPGCPPVRGRVWPGTALAAALLAAACTPGRGPAPPVPTPPAEAPLAPAGMVGWGYFGTAENDPGTCRDPKNVWMGRFAARPNSWVGQGGGTGQSLVACFPDADSCARWLGRAIGGAHGVVIIQSCTGPGKS